MAPIRSEGLKLAEVAGLRKPDMTEPRPNQGQLVQLFFNVNLGKSHRGLRMIAEEYGIDLSTLVPGQYVGFVNRAKARIKLFAAGNIYAYLVLPDDSKLTMEVIGQIPKVFQSKADIAGNEVLGEALEAPASDSQYLRRERLGAGTANRGPRAE